MHLILICNFINTGRDGQCMLIGIGKNLSVPHFHGWYTRAYLNVTDKIGNFGIVLQFPNILDNLTMIILIL